MSEFHMSFIASVVADGFFTVFVHSNIFILIFNSLTLNGDAMLCINRPFS